MRLLADGKIDAFLGFPPEPQEMRAKKIGRLVVSMTTDRPWMDYFCCMVVARRDFVAKNPVAAKRAMRAILKAASVCTTDPASAARSLVDRGFTKEYEYTLQMAKELPYARWRSYDPADSLRFYALRLHESGLIKASPPKILAQGTDWRFLNELRKELKG
jgi:NitT/TauT family transport system substrate-binding protein